MPRYRSKFEQSLAAGPLKGLQYEGKRIEYPVVKTCKYTPDWHYETQDKMYYIEAKGRFQMRNNEPYKYLFIRDSLGPSEELVFLFQNPYCFMPGAKPRKDGTKLTHAEWCDKKGFKWYNTVNIKELVG